MYDKLTTIQFSFPALSLAAAATKNLPLPKGVRFATVLDVRAEVSTAVVATTSPPRLDVGFQGNTMAMATMDVPDATAANAALNSRHPSYHFRGHYEADGLVPEQDNLLLTVSAGTGGAVAGAATVTVIVGVGYIERSTADIAAANA